MTKAKGKLLVIRVNEQEHDFIKDEARFRGITLTLLVRQALHMFLKETTRN